MRKARYFRKGIWEISKNTFLLSKLEEAHRVGVSILLACKDKGAAQGCEVFVLAANTMVDPNTSIYRRVGLTKGSVPFYCGAAFLKGFILTIL